MVYHIYKACWAIWKVLKHIIYSDLDVLHVLMTAGLWKLQSAHQKIQGLLLHKQASAASNSLTQLLKMAINTVYLPNKSGDFL